MSSSSPAALDKDKLEALLKSLGLRTLQAGVRTAYYLIAISCMALTFTLYTVIIAKFMPEMGVAWLDLFREDQYFCLLVPLTFVPTFATFYFNWITLELYKHAE